MGSGSGAKRRQRLRIFLGSVDVVERTAVQGLEQARRMAHEKFPRAIRAAGLILGQGRRGGRFPNGAQGFRQSVMSTQIRRGQARRIALAQAYVKTNQPDKASPLLAQAVAAEPRDYELRLFYARLLRGSLNGTFDDLICDAIMEQRDAEIALSPGFRWGTSVLPGAPITIEDIHNATAICAPGTHVLTFTTYSVQGSSAR